MIHALNCFARIDIEITVDFSANYFSEKIVLKLKLEIMRWETPWANPSNRMVHENAD